MAAEQDFGAQLAQNEVYKPFLDPKFDSEAFTRSVWKTKSLKNPGELDDLVDRSDSNNNKIAAITKDIEGAANVLDTKIKHQVVTYNKELIESAVSVSDLEKDLKPLAEAVKKLREHVALLSSQLREPYALLEGRVKQLENVQSTLQLLRKVQRFLTLSAKLRQLMKYIGVSSTVSSESSAQSPEAELEISSAASRSDQVSAAEILMQLIELREKTPSLKGVDLVNNELEFISFCKQKLRLTADRLLTSGVSSLNASDIAQSIQILVCLGPGVETARSLIVDIIEKAKVTVAQLFNRSLKQVSVLNQQGLQAVAAAGSASDKAKTVAAENSAKIFKAFDDMFNEIYGQVKQVQTVNAALSSTSSLSSAAALSADGTSSSLLVALAPFSWKTSAPKPIQADSMEVFGHFWRYFCHQVAAQFDKLSQADAAIKSFLANEYSALRKAFVSFCLRVFPRSSVDPSAPPLAALFLESIALFEASYLEKIGRQWSSIVEKVPILSAVELGNVNVTVYKASSDRSKAASFSISTIDAGNAAMWNNARTRRVLEMLFTTVKNLIDSLSLGNLVSELTVATTLTKDLHLTIVAQSEFSFFQRLNERVALVCRLVSDKFTTYLMQSNPNQAYQIAGPVNESQYHNAGIFNSLQFLIAELNEFSNLLKEKIRFESLKSFDVLGNEKLSSDLEAAVSHFEEIQVRIAEPFFEKFRSKSLQTLMLVHSTDYTKMVSPNPESGLIAGAMSSDYLSSVRQHMDAFCDVVLPLYLVHESRVFEELRSNLVSWFVAVFLSHLSFVRGIGEGGKVLMAADLTQIEFILSALTPNQPLKKSATDRLKAFRSLLFLDSQNIDANSAEVKVLGASLVLHHLFGRMPSELAFPAQIADKSKYIQFITSQKDAVVVLLLKQQVREYQKVLMNRGDKKYPPDFVAIDKLIAAYAPK